MQFARTNSASLQGMDVHGIEVEVTVQSFGEKSSTIIVGLPDTAVRESRERIWSSLSGLGILPPTGRVTINLAPADLRKSGTAFDLPTALCIMSAQSFISPDALKDTLIIGELALGGKVRPIRGALSIAMYAREHGINRLILPLENANEAALAQGIAVYGVQSLEESVALLQNPSAFTPVTVDTEAIYSSASQNVNAPDFLDVKGQESAKRAIMIAAAGNHNLLFIGSPGCGKSLMAQRIPGILPPLTIKEALEVTKICSIAGTLAPHQSLIVNRPFRSPHHTVSDGGLVGGSMNPRPGELSLAHNGVLFLDELPEFRRNTLEVLRQPLETGEVTISRASGTYVFPARVMLVCAMNPCPCGYYGSSVRPCTCSPLQRQAYRSRLSGPLLDRIDLHVEITPITHEQLMSKRQGTSTAQLRERVLMARQIQAERFKGTPVRYNSEMGGKMMDDYCELTSDCKRVLKNIIDELRLSARAYDRILRVSRTLADLEEAPSITVNHIQEAASYRFLDRQSW